MAIRDLEEMEPFVELDHFEIDPPSVRLLGYGYCEQNRVVILGRVEHDTEDPVTVGMLSRDARLRREIEAALRRRIQPVRLNDLELRRALEIGYERVPAVERDGLALHLKPFREFSFDPATSAPEVLDQILRRAVTLGASDVHLESYERDVDVRYRIDGVLHQITTPLSQDNLGAVMARLKVLGGLDIAERRRPQDGRVQAVYEGESGPRPIDFRLSVLPGPWGEDAVLRVLDSLKGLVSLEGLGLSPDGAEAIEEWIANPAGLILVTGPTGSGKTTTLYAMLEKLNTDERKILTVEDPIEAVFAKINQKQITPRMGFADYARAFMRQDPDVLLLGEIRDEETADAALRAAQTGHLVLSTLHTDDTSQAVTRLETLGLDRHLIAGALLAVVNQRLVRRLCRECREPTVVSEEIAEHLGLEPGEKGFYHPCGCAACGDRGYRGRVGIYEMMVFDESLADHVADGAALHDLRGAAIDAGMQTLLDDGLRQARAGATSLEEIVRVVPYRILLADRRRHGACDGARDGAEDRPGSAAGRAGSRWL